MSIRIGPRLVERKPFNKNLRSGLDKFISINIKEGPMSRALCKASDIFASDKTIQFLWLKSVSQTATLSV
jgi:hypothetical protein